MNIELKQKVREARESVTGLSQSNILTMDIDQEYAHIEAFTGKKVIFPTQLDNTLLNRGNPYIATGNMTSMESVDNFIESIVKYGKQ